MKKTRNRSRRKWLWIALVLIVGGGGVAAGVKLRRGGPEGVEVETEAVAARTIVATVTATGRIQPKTQVAISADVSAKITRLAVKEGDWVEKGTLLLELERERHVAAVESAEANLRAALSNADLARENRLKAEKDFERAQGLRDRDLESAASYDAARAAAQAEKARHQSALDQAEQSRASLRQAQDDLARTRIYAPLSGTVSKLNKEVGEIALGSQFQKDVILELSNLSGMEAVVDVDENDVVTVSLGDKATIEVDALPGVKLEGEVSEIANSAKVTGQGGQDQKTEFEAKVTILGTNDKLRPGMTASAEIVTETRDDVLGVPLQSVAVRAVADLQGPSAGEADGEGHSGEGRAPAAASADGEATPAAAGAGFQPDADGMVEIVWVVADGKAEARQVKTGIQSETHIEVAEGLRSGDEVVVGSYRAISKELKPGAAVVARSKPQPAPVVAARR